MTRGEKFLLLIFVVILCLGIDRATKEIARIELSGQGRHSLFGDTVRFQYEENPGVIMSLGSELSANTRFLLFTVVVGMCLAGLAAFACLSRTLTGSETAVLSMVVGGGFGNFLDRLLFGGVVVDFLNIGIGTLRTAVFNAADVAIIAGAVLFLLLQIRRQRGMRVPES